MSNNLEVTVTLEDFEAEQDIKKKLNWIFRNQCAQQTHCKETVDRIEGTISGIERPKISKKAVGFGGGVAVTVGAAVDRVLHYFWHS